VTFLTTSRMHPALAARVEASVRGRSSRPGNARLRAVAVAFARIAGVVGLVALVSWLVVMGHRSRRVREQAREALLDEVRARGGALTAPDFECVTRADAWLERLAADPYEGDRLADELRDPGALGGVLARRAIYVRGPLAAFATPAGIAEAAATSSKDPFVVCLLEPPPSRAESVLMGKVHEAYGGGARVELATPNVRPLHDALAGLPLLMPAWSARVRAAEDVEEIALLRRDFERAPVERAVESTRAELLLVAMDEHGDGPTELDGERPHAVRIGVVELGSAKVLARLRRSVDPKWITEARRAQYASGLDGCVLALDVRDALASNARR
jgi:hypothetical protein